MTTGVMLPETFRSMTFGDAIRAAAARDAGKVAIKHGDRELNFGDYARRGAQLRNAAIGLGAKKGDVVAIARIAGIMAAKRTADLIPLCHPLLLSTILSDVKNRRIELRLTDR